MEVWRTRWIGWSLEDASQNYDLHLLDKLLGVGLYAYYLADQKRQQSTASIFQNRDDPKLNPDTALRSINSCVVKKPGSGFQDDNQVLIITVHQSKGWVWHSFIAGTSKDELPSYFSMRDGKIEEEKPVLSRWRGRKFVYISFLERLWGKIPKSVYWFNSKNIS